MSLTATAGICEDDDELRGTVRQALEREGFTVLATASGSEVIAAFAESPPDVLVLEWACPTPTDATSARPSARAASPRPCSSSRPATRSPIA